MHQDYNNQGPRSEQNTDQLGSCAYDGVVGGSAHARNSVITISNCELDSIYLTGGAGYGKADSYWPQFIQVHSESSVEMRYSNFSRYYPSMQ